MPKDHIDGNLSTSSAKKPSDSAHRALTVNFVVSPKGGCGKSEIAKLVFDALKSTGHPVDAFDSDYNNRTFSRVGSIKAVLTRFTDDNNEMNLTEFNKVLSATTKSSAHTVIDTGSDGYNTLVDYLIARKIPTILRSRGRRVVVHSVVAGGPSFSATITAAVSHVRDLGPDVEHVVWLNDLPTFGKTDKFYSTEAGREIVASGATVIQFPVADRFLAPAMLAIFKDQLTFSDAMASDEVDDFDKIGLDIAWLPVRDRIVEVLL